MSRANKIRYKAFLDALAHPAEDGFAGAVSGFLAPDAKANAVHPINAMAGAQGYLDNLITPLATALTGLYRRDDILMGGTYEGRDWVSSTGYFVGRFINPLFGIKPTGKLAWLRVGEFHRMENGRSVESYTFLDLPELMIASGVWPLQTPQGNPCFTPGPASRDGFLLHDTPKQETAKTLHIVEAMLQGLATQDEAWRPYWHQNMMWYGPAAFGSFVGIEEFARFQTPFEAAFEGWGGGMSPTTPTRHFTRHADGNYACTGGWPSLQGTHVKPYLGFEPTGVTTRFRVCDWWRREGDLLVENWVFVDIPHALLQWGHDLFGELENT